MTTYITSVSPTTTGLYQASQGKPLQRVAQASVSTPAVPAPHSATASRSQSTPAASASSWLPFAAQTLLPSLQFGARAPYQGPFDTVKIITDYGVGKTEEISNNEIKDRFHRVLDYVRAEQNRPLLSKVYPFDTWVNHPPAPAGGTLEVDSISDIPGGNKDFVGLGLVRLGGSEPNQNIFIHVIDPGVGVVEDIHDRSILVTKDHGIYVGPNNGSLGLLHQRLVNVGESPVLYQIDFDKVTHLERLRKNDPDYALPETIHGRDVFAVVAGAIAGGLKPEALAAENPDHSLKLLDVELTDFSKPATLPTQPGEEVEVLALRDKTFSNLKLNVPLTHREIQTLLQARPQFEVQNPETGEWLAVPLVKKFSDVPVSSPLLYHGSSDGILPNTRHLELALNLDHAGDRFGIPATQVRPLRLRLAEA